MEKYELPESMRLSKEEEEEFIAKMPKTLAERKAELEQRLSFNVIQQPGDLELSHYLITGKLLHQNLLQQCRIGANVSVIVDLISELRLKGYDVDFVSLLCTATEVGDLNMIKELIELGADFRYAEDLVDLANTAATMGWFHILDYFVKRQECELDEQAILNCIGHYNTTDNGLDAIQYLVEDLKVDPTGDDNCCIKAAHEGGYTEISQYLFNKGCRW